MRKRFRSWQQHNNIGRGEAEPDPLGDLTETEQFFSAIGYLFDVDRTALPTVHGEHIYDLASKYIEVQKISARFTGDILLAEALQDELEKHFQILSRLGSSISLSQTLSQIGENSREVLQTLAEDRATQLLVSPDYHRQTARSPKEEFSAFIADNRDRLTPEFVLTTFATYPNQIGEGEASATISTLAPVPQEAPISDAAIGLLHLGEASLRSTIRLTGEDISASSSNRGLSAQYELRLIPTADEERGDQGILLWSGTYSTAKDDPGYSGFVIDYSDFHRSTAEQQKGRLPIVFSGQGISDAEALELYIRTWFGEARSFYVSELSWAPVEFNATSRDNSLAQRFDQEVRDREIAALQTVLDANSEEVYTLRVLANILNRDLPAPRGLGLEPEGIESLSNSYGTYIKPFTSSPNCPPIFERYLRLAGPIGNSLKTIDAILSHELRGREGLWEETAYEFEGSLKPAWGMKKDAIYLFGHTAPWKYRKYRDPHAIFPDGEGLVKDLRVIEGSLGVDFRTTVGLLFLEGLESGPGFEPYYQASLVLSPEDIGNADKTVPMSLRGDLQRSYWANGVSIDNQLLMLARTGVADIYIEAVSEEAFRVFQEEQKLERQMVQYVERHPIAADYLAEAEGDANTRGLFSFSLGERYGSKARDTTDKLLRERPLAIDARLEERAQAIAELRTATDLEPPLGFTIHVVFTEKSARPGQVVTLDEFSLSLSHTNFSRLPYAVTRHSIREQVNRDGDGATRHSLSSYKNAVRGRDYWPGRHSVIWAQTEITDARIDTYSGDILPPLEVPREEASDLFAKELSRYFREQLNCYWDRFK